MEWVRTRGIPASNEGFLMPEALNLSTWDLARCRHEISGSRRQEVIEFACRQRSSLLLNRRNSPLGEPRNEQDREDEATAGARGQLIF
jgi:hypothetical protein